MHRHDNGHVLLVQPTGPFLVNPKSENAPCVRLRLGLSPGCYVAMQSARLPLICVGIVVVKQHAAHTLVVLCMASCLRNLPLTTRGLISIAFDNNKLKHCCSFPLNTPHTARQHGNHRCDSGSKGHQVSSEASSDSDNSSTHSQRRCLNTGDQGRAVGQDHRGAQEGLGQDQGEGAGQAAHGCSIDPRRGESASEPPCAAKEAAKLHRPSCVFGPLRPMRRRTIDLTWSCRTSTTFFFGRLS